MKYYFTIIFLVNCFAGYAQIDPQLLRYAPADTSQLLMNLDAIYNRPLLQAGKLPVALGGYAEANYQYAAEDGVSEGHQFQFRRLTLFVSSTISQRIKFLTELEFEEGGKEINIEFASIDLEVSPLLNLRAGIFVNPIGSFNQNHDGPKWDFIERPISSSQMLPATFSNAGVGLYGKKFANGWGYAYEAYLSNGFDESIIDNDQNRTFLPATKLNPERFEESFSGSMLFTGKFAIRKQGIAEVGLSYMGGAYNKFRDDGIDLDDKRRVDVFALDLNLVVPFLKTQINAEVALVNVNLPLDYSDQFGRQQWGGFADIIQPFRRRPLFGFENSVFHAGVRFEYVDWNKGTFQTTGGNIGDEIFSIVPTLSWRPTGETVFRFNYRYSEQIDLLGNPPAKAGAIQFGVSSYF